ncbi:MAG: cyclic pyranopterin monophosphate synthase MoaC [Planctomycetaceae bacterium]|nr:cyclic pyranopterin monophosphate synthase MoaC [Planctomycetaceae bacterium]
MSQFSHFDDAGASRMVNVGAKPATRRVARASGIVRMLPTTLAAICHGPGAKGDVREVARLAGIMAAKRTADLIPLCHPLALDSVEIQLTPAGDDGLRIESQVEITAKTGVEMEALTAVTVAALTVYDMCKSMDRGMVIERVQLEAKSGGESGEFARPAAGEVGA